MKNGFIYIWEYLVEEKNQEDFTRIYGPNGDWVDLFKKAKGYIKTELHRDISNPDRFITVDYWHTKADRDKFRIEFAEDFKTLDDFCEGFTDKENFLGDFESHVADG